MNANILWNSCLYKCRCYAVLHSKLAISLNDEMNGTTICFYINSFWSCFVARMKRILTNRTFVHNNWATKPQVRRQPNFRGFFFSSFPFSFLSFIFIHRPNQIFFIKSCYQISLREFLTGERDNAWPMTLAPPHYHFSSFSRPSTLVLSHYFLFITYLGLFIYFAIFQFQYTC